MNKYKKVKMSLVFVYCVFFFTIQSIYAQIPAAQEWVDIPVVVNIIDASDANNVEAAIKIANDILKQAHIRLIVKKTNKNVEAGNNDADLTEHEGDKAQEAGQTELNNVAGAGKGIKITVADDVWTERSATNGWSVHRNPVVFVETDDPNTMGNVTAHEIVHALTVSGHSDDPNDLMYESTPRGTHLRPSDVNEVFPRAKKIGKSYFIVPRILPGRSVAVPPGIDFGIDLHGAVLDERGDLVTNNPFGTATDPEDPLIQYADLRGINLFCDEPFAPNSELKIELQLGGTFPEFFVDSFFDVYFDINLDQPGPEAMTGIHVFGDQGILETEAMWQDFGSNQPHLELPPPVIRRNRRFDTGTDPIVNNSVEVAVPIELVQLNLVSVAPIVVDGQSFAIDYQGGFSRPPSEVSDQTELFEISLTDTCPCPGITFTAPQVPEPMNPPGSRRMIISGCGFAGDVEIELDGFPAGIATADEKGGFIYVTDPALQLDCGIHAVIAKELDDTGPNGAQHAIGFFLYCPQGEDCEDCTLEQEPDDTGFIGRP